MSDGTKRTIRTGYATVVAFLLALPVLLGFLPVDRLGAPTEAKIAAFSAWVLFVNKAITYLEDHGVIPAWLRETDNPKED